MLFSLLKCLPALLSLRSIGWICRKEAFIVPGLFWSLVFSIMRLFHKPRIYKNHWPTYRAHVVWHTACEVWQLQLMIYCSEAICPTFFKNKHPLIEGRVVRQFTDLWTLILLNLGIGDSMGLNYMIIQSISKSEMFMKK